MKQACVFDWDGTLRRGITALDWMEFLGPRLPNAQAASLGMRELLDDYRSGDVNYRYLVRKAAELYAKCIAGADVNAVTELAVHFVSHDRANLFDFSAQVLKAAQQRGYEIFVISGAPVEVLHAYARTVPIDHVYGMTVERQIDRFTGTVLANYGLLGKKKEAVESILSRGYSIEVAAGNSTSDLPLLEHARSPFLITNEQEIKEDVRASFIDTQHAQSRLLEAL